MRKSHFAARRYGRVDKRWRRKVAATKGGKKDGALKGRRYDRKFEERAQCIVPLGGQIRRRAQRCGPTERTGLKTAITKADHHGSMESGRLALPDVLSARAGNRLRGIFLCHGLPANGTIFAPHLGTTFPSLTCG